MTIHREIARLRMSAGAAARRGVSRRATAAVVTAQKLLPPTFVLDVPLAGAIVALAVVVAL